MEQTKTNQSEAYNEEVQYALLTAVIQNYLRIPFKLYLIMK